jgi:hypothetical protein
VGESTGENDHIAAREFVRLVPDKFDGFVQDVADGVERVVVAIGSGKDYNSKFHAASAPYNGGKLYFITDRKTA